MIGAVILAAGKSERMGESKLLQEIGGKKVIELVIDPFRGVADEIIVVLGHAPEKLVDFIRRLGVKHVVNPDYEMGMTSSFKRGLQEAKPCEAAFLVLGDQPCVERDFLVKMVDVWISTKAKIVSPIYKGKKGHPVLFDRSLFDEILLLPKECTIRDVMHRHAKDIFLLEAGEWSIMDMDTSDDFERMKRYILERAGGKLG